MPVESFLDTVVFDAGSFGPRRDESDRTKDTGVVLLMEGAAIGAFATPNPNLVTKGPLSPPPDRLVAIVVNPLPRLMPGHLEHPKYAFGKERPHPVR